MKTQTNVAGTDAGRERVPAELLTVDDVATMLCCSSKHVHRLRDRGAMPQPVKLGNHLVRWRRADVLDWIIDGCRNVRARGGR